MFFFHPAGIALYELVMNKTPWPQFDTPKTYRAALEARVSCDVLALAKFAAYLPLAVNRDIMNSQNALEQQIKCGICKY